MAAALAPFLAVVALSPLVLRRRVDRLASRASEALAELNAHAVDTVQGLAEVLAFQQEATRKATFLDLVRRHHRVRLPFFRGNVLEQNLVDRDFRGCPFIQAAAEYASPEHFRVAKHCLLMTYQMATLPSERP